jgi:hypothetical protein
MIVDRRDFIASAALVAVARPFQLLPRQLPQPAMNLSYPVFMIDGWSVQGSSDATSSMWIRVDRSWRVAWR